MHLGRFASGVSYSTVEFQLGSEIITMWRIEDIVDSQWWQFVEINIECVGEGGFITAQTYVYVYMRVFFLFLFMFPLELI